MKIIDFRTQIFLIWILLCEGLAQEFSMLLLRHVGISEMGTHCIGECFPEDVFYTVEAEISSKRYKMALDLSTQDSWVVGEQNSKNGTIFQGFWGIFEGKTKKKQLKLLSRDNQKKLLSKTHIYFGELTEKKRNFTAKGVLSLAPMSEIIKGQVFSISLSSEKNASLLQIGSLSNIISAFSHINWISAISLNSSDLWTIGIKSLAFFVTKQVKVLSLSSSPAIIVSTSSSIGLPSYAISDFLTLMNGNHSNASCSFSHKDIICETMHFPLHFEDWGIGFQFPEGDHVVRVDARELIRSCERKKGKLFRCRLNIFQSNSDLFVLGESFLKHKIVLFDEENKRIGFGELKQENMKEKITKVIIQEEKSSGLKVIVFLLLLVILGLFGGILWLGIRRVKKKRNWGKSKIGDENKNNITKDDSDVRVAVREFEENGGFNVV